MAPIRSWLRKLRSKLIPERLDLDQWAEKHRGVVDDTLAQVLASIPESGLILDVGANVGLFTEQLRKLRPGCEYLLFEPVAKYFEMCEGRFRGVSGVEVLHLALSDTNETRSIFKAGHNPGGNSVLTEIMFDRRENSEVTERTVVEEETIQCRRFDDLARERGIDSVAFVKIDTEGFDYAVLTGLLPFLECTGQRPPILTELMSEDYHPMWREQRAIVERFVELGYGPVDFTGLPKIGDVLLLPTPGVPSRILDPESAPPTRG
ncbi:MAG: FkbM family methyltransferase [Planctomycetes bacterium]|nr:FkbM family methyltransferase [Planctomycetota bacterium]